RRAAGELEERVFIPPPALAQVIAMVADEDDDRLVRKAEPIEGVDDFSDLRIGEGRAGVIGAREFAFFAIGEGGEDILPPTGERQRRGGRNVRRVLVKLNPIQRVEVEESFGRDVRIVRLMKSDGEEKRLVAM